MDKTIKYYFRCCLCFKKIDSTPESFLSNNETIVSSTSNDSFRDSIVHVTNDNSSFSNDSNKTNNTNYLDNDAPKNDDLSESTFITQLYNGDNDENIFNPITLNTISVHQVKKHII
jgi:hypothetical protein